MLGILEASHILMGRVLNIGCDSLPLTKIPKIKLEINVYISYNSSPLMYFIVKLFAFKQLFAILHFNSLLSWYVFAQHKTSSCDQHVTQHIIAEYNTNKIPHH